MANETEIVWPENVTEWNRQTVADGLKLNKNTIKPLIDRTQYLKDHLGIVEEQIKDFSGFEIVNSLPPESEAKANLLYIVSIEGSTNKAKMYVLNTEKTAFIEIGSDHKVEEQTLYII